MKLNPNAISLSADISPRPPLGRPRNAPPAPHPPRTHHLAKRPQHKRVFRKAPPRRRSRSEQRGAPVRDQAPLPAPRDRRARAAGRSRAMGCFESRPRTASAEETAEQKGLDSEIAEPMDATDEFFCMLHVFMGQRKGWAELWAGGPGDDAADRPDGAPRRGSLAQQAAAAFRREPLTVDAVAASGRSKAEMRKLMQQRLPEGGEDAPSAGPVRNLKELYEAASAASGVFEEWVTSVADAVNEPSQGGVSVILGELKDPRRAQQKAESDYRSSKFPGAPEAWLFDVVRAKIVCESPQEVKAVALAMRSALVEFGGHAVRVKNFMLEARPSGFRDMLAHVRLPAGGALHTCEVQVLLREVHRYDRRHDCHTTYAYFRDMLSGRGDELAARLQLLELLNAAAIGSRTLQRIFERFCSVLEERERSTARRVQLLTLFYDLLFDRLEEHLVALEVAQRIFDICKWTARAKAKSEKDRHKAEASDAEVAWAVSRVADALGALGRRDAELRQCRAALQVMEAARGSEDKFTVAMVRRLAAALETRGDAEGALECHQRILVWRVKHHGRNHVDVAKSYNAMANLLRRLGRHEEALDYYFQAFEVFAAQLGGEHERTIAAQTNMANVLGLLGRAEESLNTFGAVLDTAETTYGADHAIRADALHSLAVLLSDLGRKEEAADRYSEAARTYEAVFGVNNRRVANTLNNLAVLLQQMMRFEDALHKHEKALRIRITVLGEEHPDTAASQNNLGITLSSLKRHREAVAHLEQALWVRERAFGKRHKLVAETLANQANALHRAGRGAEARRKMERALEIFREAFGAADAVVANTLYNLSDILRGLERHAEALEAVDTALRIYRPRGDMESTATALNNRGVLLELLGRHEEALVSYHEAFLLFSDSGDVVNPEGLEALANMAQALQALGRHDECVTRLEQVLDGRKRLLGDFDPEVAAALNDLGVALERAGRPDAAHDRYKEAMALQRARREDGESRAGEGDLLFNLSLLHETARGERAPAQTFMTAAAALYAVELGDDDPRTKAAEGILSRWNDHEQAQTVEDGDEPEFRNSIRRQSVMV